MDGSTDPLSKPFDLLVVGTCLPNTIVAASAALRGLRVLHVDGSPFYGAQDATLPLPQLHALLSAPPPLALAGCALRLHGALQPLPPRHLPAAGRQARQVLLDARPRLLLAQGAMTALLVASDAARYLTYRRLGACHVAQQRASASDSALPLLRVPANKGDVFLNPGLSLLEKRGVMRFLQAAMDGATLSSVEEGAEEEGGAGGAAAGEEAAPGGGVGLDGSSSAVQWLNEAVLGSGRSLLRPQNKSASALNEAAFAARPMLELLRDGAGLSPRTTELLLYALALHGGSSNSSSSNSSSTTTTTCSSSLSGAQGMQRIRGYLTALSRYGGTAFLAHEYGCGSLCEAFSRLAAVHGAVYMLGFEPEGWGVQGRGHAAEAAAATAAGGSDAAEPLVTVGLAMVQSTASGGGSGGGAEHEVITVTARRVLIAPSYAALLPPSLLALAPAPHSAAAACTVVCISIVREEAAGGRSTASQHTVIPPPAAAAAPAASASAWCRTFPINVLEQGVEDKVAPSGLRVLYFYCSVAAGEVEAASVALVQEANSGAWFGAMEVEEAEEVAVVEEGEGGAGEGASDTGGGVAAVKTAEAAAAAAAAPVAAALPPSRRLLWQVCYSLTSNHAPSAAAAAAAPAPAPAPATSDAPSPLCLVITPTSEQLAHSQAAAALTTTTAAAATAYGPWLGCSVVNEEDVAIAEAAHASLFPGVKLFSSVTRGAAGEEGPGAAGAEEGTEGAEAEAQSEGAEAAAQGAAVGEQAATCAAADGSTSAAAAVPAAAAKPLTDLEEALAMLQSEPLDF